MKKAKQGRTADEPIGIVIAWGGTTPTVPAVKAYMWYSPDWPNTKPTEE
jgi:hypothetical protein